MSKLNKLVTKKFWGEREKEKRNIKNYSKTKQKINTYIKDTLSSTPLFLKYIVIEIAKEGKRCLYKAITGEEPPKPKKEMSEYGEFPKALLRGEIPFGKARTQYGYQTVYFPKDDNNHKIGLGATRSGKTTWAKQFVLKTKTGVCYLDNADGRAIDDILLALPEERLKKTVIIDHSDKYNSLPINIFRLEGDLFDDDELAEQWIDFFITNFDLETQYMTQDIISNACRAVFANPNTTILDVVRMVQSSKAREYFLKNCKNKDVIRWWERYAKVNSKEGADLQATASFLRRANVLLRNRVLKYTLGCHNPVELDYRKWMDEGWTVLIKVPKILKKEPVRLISSMHFNNFIQATYSRMSMKEEDRKRFFFIADEPQSWLSKNGDRLSDMFSEAAKYGLSLILLFQSFQQIRKESPALVDIMQDNMPDLIVFTTSNNQLRLGHFNLEKLPKYHFIGRIRDVDEPFLAKSLGTIKFVRKEMPYVLKECKEKYNIHYQILENECERKDSEWENEVNIDETMLESPMSGLKPSVSQGLRRKTKEYSSSFTMFD